MHLDFQSLERNQDDVLLTGCRLAGQPDDALVMRLSQLYGAHSVAPEEELYTLAAALLVLDVPVDLGLPNVELLEVVSYHLLPFLALVFFAGFELGAGASFGGRPDLP
jgi:hypothetical protein